MDNSTSLFLHRIFKGIADSTIKVFIPLLIYKQTHDLFLAILFTFVDYFLAALFFVVLKKFVQKHALLCIIIHIIPIIIAEFILVFAVNIYTIFILSLMSALSSVLYYGALNLIFGIVDENTNTAKFEAGRNIGNIVSVLLSAYILGELNNSLIFITIFSLIMYVISVIPLCLKYKELKERIIKVNDYPIKTILKDVKHYSIYHFFNGFTFSFQDVFLPLYLFVQGSSLASIGLIKALQYGLFIVAGYLTKYISSKRLSIVTIISSAVLYISSLIVILFVKNITVAYIFSIVFFFANQACYMTLFGKYTKEQREKGYIYDSIFYRDVFLNSGRATVSLIYIIFPFVPVLFGCGMVAGAGIGVFGSLCCKNEFDKNQSLVDTNSVELNNDKIKIDDTNNK